MKTQTLFLLILLIAGCTSKRYIEKGNVQRDISIRAVGGIEHGGIIENTDMSVVENSTVDAVSGATKTGFNAGAHALFPMNGNDLETGLEYQLSFNELSFNDPNNDFNGIRDIQLSQIVVPFTYNINIFKKNPELLSLKMGGAFQLNLPLLNDTGNLPEYTINRLSSGVHIEISSLPFHFNNGSKAGASISGYRGSQIYEDYYNRSEFEEPGSSYYKFNLIYQF
ncbi:MAG: hypothetical protein K9G70_03965 [Prolixibacteraceae bacterium]|nr:hypothetical protein [Prolixibacteraceae bacterium]